MVTSQYMRLALAEADRARGRTAPNPPVGAVLVRDGHIVGCGHTQPAGGAHAEVMALCQAGPAARGATLFVTLEPCSHHGRTPPCTEALIAAGVVAVRAALEDPNPLVAGGGVARLRQAGIDVDVGDGAPDSAALLRPFFKHIRTGIPFVTAKWAMTLDGRIATASGDSRWVSGVAARQWAHALRDSVDAVIVGLGTVLADDPALTVRLDDGELRAPRPKAPLRVVLDSACRIPMRSRLLAAGSASGTLVATTERAPGESRAAVAATSAEVAMFPADRAGHVDLQAVLVDLGRRGCLHVLVEGGAEVHASLLLAHLADEVAVIVAPKVVGGRQAIGPVSGSGVARMAEALDLSAMTVQPLGADLLIQAPVGQEEPAIPNADPVFARVEAGRV